MLPSELLLECMERRNLSLSLMSTYTGIRESVMQRYLDGEIPTDRDIEKICNGLNIDENDITYDDLSISVKECAMLMNEGIIFVRCAIEKKRLPGICVESKGRKKYHIPRKAFMQYMEQWNSPLKEEVDLLKKQLSGLTGVIMDLTNTLKNAPIRQDRAHDNLG